MTPTAAKVLELHRQGMSRAEMAREAGCSRVYAWMVLKAAGEYVPDIKTAAQMRKGLNGPAKPKRHKPAVRKFTWEGAE